MKTAAIVTIGDEILIGQIIDTNKAYLSKKLTEIGLIVKEQKSIEDDEEAIFKTLDEYLEKVDLIIFSGGLGPTKDDVTKKAVANYYGRQLEKSQETYQRLEQYFLSRGRQMNVKIEDQSYYPSGAKIFPNSAGTAQGFMMIDQAKAKTIFLPGVPREVEALMMEEILPYLQSNLSDKEGIVQKTLLTAMISESQIEEEVEEILAEHKQVKIAFLPHLGGVRIRASMSRSNPRAEEEVNKTISSIQKKLGEHALSTEYNSISETLHHLLLERGLTISTAESCTGGYIAHKLTTYSGSSSYFVGSVVAYSNEVKVKTLGVSNDDINKEGAVSEVVVKEMLEGALKTFQTDLAISTSGIAGPTGGTPEKPVGTMWIAFGNKEKITAKKLFYNRSRLMNIEYATNGAMFEIIRFIKNNHLKR